MKHNNKNIGICSICGNVFDKTHGNKKYCCDECKKVARRYSRKLSYYEKICDNVYYFDEYTVCLDNYYDDLVISKNGEEILRDELSNGGLYNLFSNIKTEYLIEGRGEEFSRIVNSKEFSKLSKLFGKIEYVYKPLIRKYKGVLL